MFTSGTSPPSGLKLSCIEFTAPQEASVVTVAKSAEAAVPKRTSFPSMFPAPWSSASEARAWFGFASAQCAVRVPPRNITAIAARMAHPWRLSRAIRP